MQISLHSTNSLTFNGQQLATPEWSASLTKSGFTEWPIIVQRDKEMVTVGSWGLTPSAYCTPDQLTNARDSGRDFYATNQPECTTRCIILSDAGFIAGYYRTWIDTQGSDFSQTFAIAGTEDSPILLGESEAREWLNQDALSTSPGANF